MKTLQKKRLPVAFAIAKPLDIVATRCLRLETIYDAAIAACANRVFSHGDRSFAPFFFGLFDCEVYEFSLEYPRSEQCRRNAWERFAQQERDQ